MAISKSELEAMNDLLGKGASFFRENEASSKEVVAREVRVRHERKFRHGRVAEALLGHVAQARNAARLRVEVPDGLAVERHEFRRRPVFAGSHSH